MEYTNHELTALFSVSRDCVIGVRGGAILYMNPAAITVFGDCMGQNARTLLPEHILETDSDSLVAAVHIRKENYALSSSVIDGTRLFLLCPAEQETEELGEISTFLSTMRATLASMRLAIERMRRGHHIIDMGGNEYKSIDVMQHCYYQLSRLAVNAGNLVDFESGDFSLSYSRLDLVELCYNLVSTVGHFTQDRGINITFGCRLSSIAAVVDRDLIEKLVLHLVLNSMMNMENGGNIRVTLAKLGDSAVISVDDDGEGMLPERLSGIFSGGEKGALDPKQGLGIGLRICRHIVEAHNGSIVIESRRGEGTSVRAMIGLDNNEASRFKSAEVTYRPDGMEMVLTQLSIWLNSTDYGQKYLD